MTKINRHTVAFKTSTVILSRIISATISLVFVPLYIKLLGVESYGLVAFYLLLMGVLVVVDLALSTALSRQVVILKTNNESEKAIKDLVFSIEIIYATISLAIAASIYFFADTISNHWLKVNEIPINRLVNSIRFMGVLIALQFPTSIYNGVMISLDKQVLNSTITIIINVLKAVGVIAVLKIFSPIIENYFIWQIFITIGALFTLRYFVWKQISVSKTKAHFSLIQLAPIKNFSVGMIGVALVNFSLSMVDKLIVSKSVPLNLVACYSLAFQVAAIIGQLVSPLQSTIFPKFTSLITNNNVSEYVKLYHKSCKWVAISIWPIGLGLFFFAKDILLIWSKNDFIVANTTTVLQVVVIGTVCNCLMFVPYIFMLSKGKTRFTIVQNIIGAVIFLPMLYWTIPKYGILGASFMWLAINVSYVLISIPIFHKLYMKNELSNWYIKDNLFPFAISVLIIGGAKFIRLKIELFQSNIIFGVLAFILAILYAYTIPELRKMAFQIFKISNK
jgi:O-antigen/teichoic acid export membrane protein